MEVGLQGGRGKGTKDLRIRATGDDFDLISKVIPRNSDSFKKSQGANKETQNNYTMARVNDKFNLEGRMLNGESSREKGSFLWHPADKASNYSSYPLLAKDLEECWGAKRVFHDQRKPSKELDRQTKLVGPKSSLEKGREHGELSKYPISKGNLQEMSSNRDSGFSQLSLGALILFNPVETKEDYDSNSLKSDQGQGIIVEAVNKVMLRPLHHDGDSSQFNNELRVDRCQLFTLNRVFMCFKLNGG